MNLIEREAVALFHTYKRLPLEVERGEGVHLIAKDGRRYLDMFAGLAVNALGYNHPTVLGAIQKQLQRYLHLSNVFYQDTQIELAERLLKASGYARAFLSNSGTEAMEGALKLARRWGKSRGKTTIFGLTGSFHGRTLGSLSITGREKYREGYEPFLPDTCFLAHNSVAELERTVNGQTLAVVLEFIQGEGGINIVSSEYVEALRFLRDKHGFLLIADEIQSGIGRTGRFMGYEHFQIVPDIVVVAKALGGGLPLGAFIAGDPLKDVFPVGTHGTTFGGNPVACAAGIATLAEITENGVMSNAASTGSHFADKLRELAYLHPDKIKEVRGFGLMLGLELFGDATPVSENMLARGVLVNATNRNVIRLLPPLIITNTNVDQCVSVLESVL